MKKVKIDNIYKQMKIELDDFNKLSNDDQYIKVEEVLKKMYENKVDVSKPYVLKCIKLSVSKADDYLYLSNNLTVEKNPKEIVFYFKKKASKMPIIILLVSTLLIGGFSATYSGLVYLEMSKINVDLDGDGIADINIDTDNDKIPDLNIDLDDDQKPDMNIDYKGNMKPMFNIDKDGDGKPDFNMVNDGEDPTKCEVNCDSNGDGWPDYNYDIDGDGKPDLDIDTDDDGHVDNSIDLDGDLVCDIMCDDDGDGVCDRNCKEFSAEDEEDLVGSGSSVVTGNGNSDLSSGQLSVIYEDYGELLVEGLLPDDHTEGVVHPEKKFSVTNLSDFDIIYKMTLVVEKNTFTSQNFEYKLDSTNGGLTSDYATAPWEDTLLSSYIRIGAKETQDYTMTFRIKGLGEPQNYDQGRTFEGFIRVGD